MGRVRIVQCKWCKEDYATRKDGISQHLKCGKRNDPVDIPYTDEPDYIQY